jgi:hypothetical protein
MPTTSANAAREASKREVNPFVSFEENNARPARANLTVFAVPVQLYVLTRNSAYVGLAGIFALVPLVVFGLLGGAWADGSAAAQP